MAFRPCRAPRSLTTACSVKPPSHVASGQWRVRSGVRRRAGLTTPSSGPSPARGRGQLGLGELGAAPPGRPGGAGSPGVAAGPRPGGVSGRPRHHLKGRAGPGPERRDRGAGGRAPGAGSGAGFESGPGAGSGAEPGAGAMASSGPAGPLLLLLLVLLAGSARAGLHFRPGRGCYRPLRGDRLSSLGRRSAPAWGASRALLPFGDPASSLGCQQPRHPAPLDL